MIVIRTGPKPPSGRRGIGAISLKVIAPEGKQPLQNLVGEGVASEPRHGKGSPFATDAPSPTRKSRRKENER